MTILIPWMSKMTSIYAGINENICKYKLARNLTKKSELITRLYLTQITGSIGLLEEGGCAAELMLGTITTASRNLVAHEDKGPEGSEEINVCSSN